MNIEELVAKYGEKYRILITDSIKWLTEQEEKWGLKINQETFIENLIFHTKKFTKEN